MIERAPETGILEREPELAEAAGALARAAGGSGSVLLVRGPAGIGKTSLARAIVEQARAAGMASLWARGGELERDFPYGVVRQLLEPPLARAEPAARARLLAGAAALSLSVVAEPGAVPEDAPAPRVKASSVLHGLYWLVSNIAEETPLVLCVDDLQWADAASFAFVLYLARRIEELPVCFIATERSPEVGVDDVSLSRLAAEPATLALELEPLSIEAVTRLVERSVDGPADEAFCLACHEATGGNPFLVHELLASIAAEGIEARASGAAAIVGLAPGSVARSVLVRLARLPEEARTLARVLTVLGSDAPLHVAAHLSEVDPERAARAADVLSQAGIIAERSLDFVHPLIRQAVATEVPGFERASLHGRAAQLLHAAGAPAQGVATHLLACDPRADPWTVDVLCAAAARALDEGAPLAAIRYLKRALEEPPTADVRIDVLVQLGRAQALAADAEAMTTLDEALALGIDPARRAEVALQLARAIGVTIGDVQRPYEMLAGIDTATLEPDLALRIEAERIGLALATRDRDAAVDRAFALASQAEPARPAAAVLLANLGMLSLTRGDPAETAAGFALGSWRAGIIDEDSFQFDYAARTLVRAERFDDAADMLAEAIDEGVRRGSVFLVASPSMQRGHLMFRLGRLRDAEADLRVALELIGLEPARTAPWARASGYLADVLIERGEWAEAEAIIAASGLVDGVMPEQQPSLGHVLFALGTLRAAQGRVAEAIEHLLPFTATRIGPAEYPWRSTLAMLLARDGDVTEAKRLAAEEVEIARRQGLVRGLGIALRAQGIVEGGASGVALLQEAAAVLARSPAEVEHARALTDLGAALRRTRRAKDAREPLARAREIAHRCGAVPIAERARHELLAAGARPRRLAVSGVDALTASERRVAQLAADGLSNREIAQALFVSVRTVATHLTSTYQKLGVTGRDALAGVLSDGS